MSPGSIVGALTNEGGLDGSQVGNIDIRGGFSLVDLPKDLNLGDLSDIRINGNPLDIQPDRGGNRGGGQRGGNRSGGYRGGRGGNRGDRGGYRGDRGARKGGFRKF